MDEIKIGEEVVVEAEQPEVIPEKEATVPEGSVPENDPEEVVEEKVEDDVAAE